MPPRRRDSRSTRRRASLAVDTGVDAVSRGRSRSGALRLRRERRNVSLAASGHTRHRRSTRMASSGRTKARTASRRGRRRHRGHPPSVRSARTRGGRRLRRRRFLRVRRREAARRNVRRRHVLPRRVLPRGTARSGTPRGGTPRGVAVDRNLGVRRRERRARGLPPSGRGRLLTATSTNREVRPALARTRSRGTRGPRPRPSTSTGRRRDIRSDEPGAGGPPSAASGPSTEGVAHRDDALPHC